MSKSNPDIFRDQPVIGAGEETFFAEHLANWGTVNKWVRSKPTLVNLQKAAIFEAEDKARIPILERLLTRIFQLEKREALQKLALLKK